MYLHRSVVQNGSGTSASLLQAGWATVGSNISFGDCGTTNSRTYEYVERDDSGSFVCWYYDQGFYPTDYNFNVYNTGNGWGLR